MSKRPLLLTAAVAVLAGLAATPAAEGANRKKCKQSGATTITESKKVWVYEVDTSGGTTMYGCRKGNGRRVKLDNGTEGTDAYNVVQIVDNQVSWVSTLTPGEQGCKADCPPGTNDPKVRIAVHSVKTGENRSVPAAPLGEAVVLAKNGGVAWAAAGAKAGEVQIHMSPRGAEDRIIDTGAIDPETLDIEITIMSWRKAGAEMFARLN